MRLRWKMVVTLVGTLASVGIAGCGSKDGGGSAKSSTSKTVSSPDKTSGDNGAADKTGDKKSGAEAAASGEAKSTKAPAKQVQRKSELEVSNPKDYRSETEETALGTVPDGVGLRPAASDAAPVMAPDFTATDSNGKAQTLDTLVAKGPVLLVFYRGGW